MSDYILLIMNCEKYRYKALKQKETWLKTLPANLAYFHVLGDPDLPEPFYFDEKERILWVRGGDDYNSLPHKVISAFQAVEETYKYKYIFKTDDDQQLLVPGFFPMIMNLIGSMTPNPHYGGHIVDVALPHISTYYIYHPELPKNLLIQKTKYCNGRFYFLSADAVKDLIMKKDIIQKEYLEDYAIGFYLDPKWKENILPINTKKYFEDGTF